MTEPCAVLPANTTSSPPSDVCPRCQGRFHCGVADTQPCACYGLALDAPLIAWLRNNYRHCLCVPCLRELQAHHRATGTAGDPRLPAD